VRAINLTPFEAFHSPHSPRGRKGESEGFASNACVVSSLAAGGESRKENKSKQMALPEIALKSRLCPAPKGGA